MVFTHLPRQAFVIRKKNQCFGLWLTWKSFIPKHTLLWGAGKNELRPAVLTGRSCINLFVIIYTPASTDHIQLLETVWNFLIFKHALLLSQTWAQHCLLVFLKTLEPVSVLSERWPSTLGRQKNFVFFRRYLDECFFICSVTWSLLPVQTRSQSFIKRV